MSMGLHELQRQFAAALDPQADEEVLAQVGAMIRPGLGLDAWESLAVYRNNVFGAHHNALRQIFPVCEQILGEALFTQLARQYLWAFPSQSPDLNLYGEKFPAHVTEQVHAHLDEEHYAYLGDLATLEWLWHALYYRPDAQAFPFEQLAGLSEQDQEYVCFQPSTKVAWMMTSYPIREIWQRHRETEAVSEVTALEEVEYLLLQHRQGESSLRRIDARQYALLQACREGHSLAEIAARLEQAEAVLACLPEALTQDWISGFRLAGSR